MASGIGLYGNALAGVNRKSTTVSRMVWCDCPEPSERKGNECVSPKPVVTAASCWWSVHID